MALSPALYGKRAINANLIICFCVFHFSKAPRFNERETTSVHYGSPGTIPTISVAYRQAPCSTAATLLGAYIDKCAQ